MDGGDTHLRQGAQNLWRRLRLTRREPWNWLAQNLAAVLLPPGLMFHNWPLIVLSLAGMASACLPLPLPPMEHTGAKRLAPRVEKLIGLESAWLAAPMSRRKKRQLWLLGLGAPLTALFLWLQDLGPIGIALAVWTLLAVRRKNIEDGIKP